MPIFLEQNFIISILITLIVLALIFSRKLSFTGNSADTDKIKETPLAVEDNPEIARLEKRLEAAEAQIRQLSKLSQIGQLAAGVAHELNTPLSTIVTTIRLLGKTNPNEKQSELLDIISSSANLCASVIKKLLIFTRQSSSKEMPVNLEETLNDTITLLEHQISLDRIALIRKLTSVPSVKGDPNEFSQVFANLLLNARDAVLAKLSELQIFSRTLTYNPKIIVSLYRKDNSAIVDIYDNGAGISAENMEKVFQPFFTTKDIGKGTGLGLYISNIIVQKWGGEIQVSSTKGEGTHFIVRFPVQGERAAPTQVG